jgi:RNA polymerase sigma-70 factor (ECF subfamily)
VSLDKAKTVSFDEDLILVERFLANDADAFQTLYLRYYDKVFAIARGILLDPDEAADAVQEIFSLVYRNLPKFDQRSKFSTWLFRIAVNRSIQQARSIKFKSRYVELDEALMQAETVEEVEVDPNVDVAMAQLAPADRALLTLFYWEELSLIEIADSLGTNVNAAKTRLYRARERFRQLYEKAVEG